MKYTFNTSNPHITPVKTYITLLTSLPINLVKLTYLSAYQTHLIHLFKPAHLLSSRPDKPTLLILFKPRYKTLMTNLPITFPSFNVWQAVAVSGEAIAVEVLRIRAEDVTNAFLANTPDSVTPESGFTVFAMGALRVEEALETVAGVWVAVSCVVVVPVVATVARNAGASRYFRIAVVVVCADRTTQTCPEICRGWRDLWVKKNVKLPMVQSLLPSVWSSVKIVFNIRPFTTITTRLTVLKICQYIVSKFCHILNKPTKVCQTILKICQIGKFCQIWTNWFPSSLFHPYLSRLNYFYQPTYQLNSSQYNNSFI